MGKVGSGPSAGKIGEVDPAALLVAVLTVAIAPLTQEGPWNYLNTLIAVLVLSVLIYYLGSEPSKFLPWHKRLREVARLTPVPVLAVLALVAAVAAAWPVQHWIVGSPDSCTDVQVFLDLHWDECSAANEGAERATRYSLIAFAVVFAIVLLWRVWLHRRESRNLRSADSVPDAEDRDANGRTRDGHAHSAHPDEVIHPEEGAGTPTPAAAPIAPDQESIGPAEAAPPEGDQPRP